MRVLTPMIIAIVALGSSVSASAVENIPQPLTRADCEKAGMKWNDNANVCGGKEEMGKPETKAKKKK